MISAVNPTSNGFGGGVLAPAGRPTTVGGAFASPGTAAATPPGVPSSGIIEARNNKGSNVQVPYARLVPMHSDINARAEMLSKRTTNPNLKDLRFLTVNGTPQLEYDGLHQGELAWILGRRFKSAVDAEQGGAANGIAEFTDVERYAHQAFAGLGSGVDRMQRLASTGWVESLFQERLNGATINLHNINLDSPYAKAMDSGIGQFKSYLLGATALHCPDVTKLRALRGAEEDMVTGEQRLQGINVIDTSPFLTGFQVSSDLIRFDGGKVPESSTPDEMPRNQGNVLCVSALETELRRRNIMDWTPDGIVLSKLESPTDEPMKSTEIDARQAQLFNIGIQGPSITKSWTSDLQNHRLQVQPMDKVFVVVVARLSYRATSQSGGIFENIDRDRAEAINVEKAYHDHLKAVAAGKDVSNADYEEGLKEAYQRVADATNELKRLILESKEPEYDIVAADVAVKTKVLGSVKEVLNQKDKEDAEKALSTANTKLNNILTFPSGTETDEIKDASRKNHSGELRVLKARLTNFHLMRTTSSHMANYSYYKPGDQNSRLGLMIGAHKQDGSGGTNGVRDVIVGGWCIGTVADSAASRSTIGFQTVKSHPTSMAININVNVQWWSGDKLHKHYHDAGGLVMMRGSKRDRDIHDNYTTSDELYNPEAKPKTEGEEGGDVSASRNRRTSTFIPPVGGRDVRARTEPIAASAFSVSEKAESSSARARPGGSRRA